ncbi:hypothetical protein P43SY_002954 [Pythium insidiosum]|uniref:Uncharacterized protein n=1 Tax=Pythium insidiosum TaxID=114742 RepID=A0AAD5LIM2_PYTIN|nr:hypothetical protein P43SY_002954 [Pythium insidiosum]
MVDTYTSKWLAFMCLHHGVPFNAQAVFTTEDAAAVTPEDIGRYFNMKAYKKEEPGALVSSAPPASMASPIAFMVPVLLLGLLIVFTYLAIQCMRSASGPGGSGLQTVLATKSEKEMLPDGLKGFVLASLLAAAMTTFDTTINSTSSSWTVDIYQALLRPDAGEKQLLWHACVSTFIIMILGLLFSLHVHTINRIWCFMTIAMAGAFIWPFFFSWYWARFNLSGFIAAMAIFIKVVLECHTLPHGMSIIMVAN